MPELSRECKASSECEYQWFKSQWSACTAECGKGIQNRRVICGHFDGEVIRPSADDTKCSAADKPIDTKECDGKTKECPGQWFTGPWSDCSQKCGGGTHTRKVLCIADGVAVKETSCNEETIEFATDACNKDPCLEDETIPVDATSKPIEEDDEGEEWCDEDEQIPDAASGVLKATPSDGISDGIELDSSDATETSPLITDDLMLSDAPAFETDSTQNEETATDIIG